MSAPFKPPVYRVDPSRLASGTWCHHTDKMVGEGDIRASYSADRIGMGQPVRRPFKWQGGLFVCTGIRHCRENLSLAAYALVPRRFFDGEVMTYAERVADGDRARSDPKGFYHGMRVSHGKQEHVLSGPPSIYVAGKAEQLALF